MKEVLRRAMKGVLFIVVIDVFRLIVEGGSYKVMEGVCI